MPSNPTDSNSDSQQAYANLSLDSLRLAAKLYLQIAYPDGEPPASVKKRLVWKDAANAFDVLNHPPFEKAGKSGFGSTPIFALRLGNARYPHMKLQVQPWNSGSGFLLSVNTHDQVMALDPTSPDAPAFRILQAENQKYKQSIEQAWDEAGLPIFLRFLRDYLSSNPGAV